MGREGMLTNYFFPWPNSQVNKIILQCLMSVSCPVDCFMMTVFFKVPCSCIAGMISDRIHLGFVHTYDEHKTIWVGMLISGHLK